MKLDSVYLSTDCSLSLPSRERGLKLIANLTAAMLAAVAPLAGAWIETSKTSKSINTSNVAPLAGAWIETAQTGQALTDAIVAPLAGAWIETGSMILKKASSRRSPRGSVD